MVTRDELLSTLDAATCTENRNVAGDSKINPHEAIPKQNLHEAIPKQNLLEAVRLLCYRVIVLSPYHGAIPKQNLNEAVRLSCCRVIAFLALLNVSVTVISCYGAIVFCISSARTSSRRHQLYIEKFRFQPQAGSPPIERFAISS